MSSLRSNSVKIFLCPHCVPRVLHLPVSSLCTNSAFTILCHHGWDTTVFIPLPVSSVCSNSVQTFLCPHCVPEVFTPSCFFLVFQQRSHLPVSSLCSNGVHNFLFLPCVPAVFTSVSSLCSSRVHIYPHPHCVPTVFTPSCVLIAFQQCSHLFLYFHCVPTAFISPCVLIVFQQCCAFPWLHCVPAVLIIIIIIIIIINPLTARVVGAPQMILQPLFSIFPCSPLPSGTWRTPGLSIPWCCLPNSTFVRLVFFSLSLCLAIWFWPDLMSGKHDHTTAVCVSLRS